MYLHALTNKMVPDANSLLIEQLPEVAGNLAEQCWVLIVPDKNQLDSVIRYTFRCH